MHNGGTFDALVDLVLTGPLFGKTRKLFGKRLARQLDTCKQTFSSRKKAAE